MCRLTKKNGSRPRRAATGGLAARERTMPASISAPMAASVSRSTVHHHSPKGVRSARECIQIPVALKLTRRGLGRINGRGYTRDSLYNVGEGFAAHFEIRILIERGAGRREQYHRFFQARCLSIAGSRRNRRRKNPVHLMRYLAVEGTS